MIKLHRLSAGVLAVILAGCGADAPDKTPISKPVETPTLKSAPDNSAAKAAAQNAAKQTAAFQAACRETITAKMPDPSAAKISYTPLSGADGFKAAVDLAAQEGGDVLTFNYTCTRTADGGVVTKRIGD